MISRLVYGHLLYSSCQICQVVQDTVARRLMELSVRIHIYCTSFSSLVVHINRTYKIFGPQDPSYLIVGNSIATVITPAIPKLIV